MVTPFLTKQIKFCLQKASYNLSLNGIPIGLTKTLQCLIAHMTISLDCSSDIVASNLFNFTKRCFEFLLHC